MCGLTKVRLGLFPDNYRCASLRKRSARKRQARVNSGSKQLVEPSTPIEIALASDSKLLLEGLRKILEVESGIKIVAEASGCEGAAAHLSEVEIEFLFIDTRALDVDARELSNLINRKGTNTKIILFESQTKDKINLPGVIYVTKETSSLELINIIKRTGAVPLHSVR